MNDQKVMQDPTKMYADRVPDEQYLPGPGTDEKMSDNVPADHGEDTYRGAGRLQYREAGIRVDAVAPGPIWTPLQPAGGQPPDALPSAGEQTYLGRWGHPAELAPAYVFLASGESSYVVGETLRVDGNVPTP